MAQLIRAKDWSATPLGAIDTWPQSLRTTVSLCLASNFPINIVWGAGHTQIYNDGYRIVCGDAHPRALGEDYSVTWASAWPAIGEPFARALAGETSFLENQRMFLTRNGYLEETFFTFSTSPIRDESGGIGGLFHPVTETTPAMLSERRTRALRDLTATLGDVTGTADLAARTVATLARFEFDLPFSLIYRLDDADGHYVLLAQHGVEPGTAISPLRVAATELHAWIGMPQTASGTFRDLTGLAKRLGKTACGPYDEVPDRGFVAGVGAPGERLASMLVVVGASPRLPFNEGYRGFFELLAATIGAADATARSRQHERERIEALAEIDRAKTAFFSNVSHEFRTPLTLLLAPLEELLRSSSFGADDLERLTLAHRNALRLLRLVNSLLDFSRLEAHRAAPSLEPLELSTVTSDLASNFRSACEQAGLALVVDAPPLWKPVCVDRDMWEKVVLNLLSNAFKFTMTGEIRVAVHSSDDGEFAVLKVSDTGTGIPDAERSRIFERFHRVEGTRGRSIEGTGIGLALVQEIVRLHGGSIDVTSEVGRGSTFEVSIPFGVVAAPSIRSVARSAADPDEPSLARAFVDEALHWLPKQATPAEATGAAESAPHRGRILVADDNNDMRRYVKRLLVEQGFEVIETGDGREALDTARARAPDLLLSDVMMPTMNGFELLAAVRADPVLRDLPFVLLSARAGEEARVEGLDAGADDYLTKPFAARELIARVATNLELARERREAMLRRANAELEREVADRVRERSQTWLVTSDLLAVLDRAGVFENVNPAWHATLGWQPSDLHGTTLAERTHPDDRGAVDRALATLADGAASRFESRVLMSDDGFRWLQWVVVPEGEHLYCSARDITAAKGRELELRDAQEALRRSQKIEAIGRLTGGIAHDFNNILMVLSGGVEMIGRQNDPERRERLLKGMRQAAQRGASLTRQMLAFSRRQSLQPEPTSLAVRIGGMRELLGQSLRGDVEVTMSFPDDLWTVEIDPGELELVILNLCVNSRDAMPSGGTIEIAAENRHHVLVEGVRGDYVCLVVRDTGAGMSQDTQSKLFEPFFTTKDVGKGSGLGLAQVYGFVRQSSGSIQVESEVGIGTTVALFLPRSDKQQAVPPLPQAGATRDARRFPGTVLLVEDDEEVAGLVGEMLGTLGFEVVRAASGRAALGALADERAIDLVFSDVMMPGGMNGIELATEIRHRKPTLPILLTSGYAESALKGTDLQGLRILAKPYGFEELTVAFEQLLAE